MIAVLVLKVLLLLQLVVVHRCRRSTTGRTALASTAIVLCAVLLTTGQQAQRMRTSKGRQVEDLLLRDRAAAMVITGRRD